MAEPIVDSSVIIDYLRGNAAAARFLESLASSSELATHVVVVAEILVGARDRREQQTIERLLDCFHVHPIEASDSHASLELLKRDRLSHGVGWLDCLIAATCLRLDLSVVTLNEKHFSVFDQLEVSRPY